MAVNDFLPFATAIGANVLDQADYAALAAVATGFEAGIAQSVQLNKVWRQSSFVAAAIAKFIVNQTGLDALDNGDLTTFVADFTAAIATAGGVPAFASNAQALAGVSTNLIISPASLAYVINNLCLLLSGGTISGALTVGGLLTASGGVTTSGGLTVSGGSVSLPAASLSGAALIAATVADAALATQPAGTVLANNTGGVASPTPISYATLLTALGIVVPTSSQFRVAQPSGTGSGEALTGSAWNQRALNTTVFNSIAGASLSGHQISLPAGTYRASASGFASKLNAAGFLVHVLRVRDITHAATLAVGPHAGILGYAGTTEIGVNATLEGQFTLAGTSTIELDSWVSSSGSGGGGGGSDPPASSGEDEVYADVLLTKVA